MRCITWYLGMNVWSHPHDQAPGLSNSLPTLRSTSSSMPAMACRRCSAGRALMPDTPGPFINSLYRLVGRSSFFGATSSAWQTFPPKIRLLPTDRLGGANAVVTLTDAPGKSTAAFAGTIMLWSVVICSMVQSGQANRLFVPPSLTLRLLPRVFAPGSRCCFPPLHSALVGV